MTEKVEYESHYVTIRASLGCTPPNNKMDSEVQNAMKYLVRFGYIENQDAKVKEIPADVLTKFQEFHGIATTGVLDDATLELMKLPRCRVKDFQPDVSHRSCRHLTMPNSKPLAYNWGKWDKTTLTWRVTQYSRRSGMPKELVHEGLRRAFSKWERHSPIRFEWVETGVPDIEIRWEMEEHGDGDEFDGEGGTLAHAFLPNGDRISGDLHFDDAEMWTLGTADVGVNLTQVAAHEVGHSLGMLHSKDPTALMAPVYRGYMPDFDLCPDDIERIQALYGKPNPDSELNPVVEKEEKWIPENSTESENSIESRISFWDNWANWAT